MREEYLTPIYEGIKKNIEREVGFIQKQHSEVIDGMGPFSTEEKFWRFDLSGELTGWVGLHGLEKWIENNEIQTVAEDMMVELARQQFHVHITGQWATDSVFLDKKRGPSLFDHFKRPFHS